MSWKETSPGGAIGGVVLTSYILGVDVASSRLEECVKTSENVIDLPGSTSSVLPSINYALVITKDDDVLPGATVS